MRKIALGIAASVALTGCAKPPASTPTVYDYKSLEHSGVVSVTEVNAPGDYKCPNGWRDGSPYVPNGVRKWVSYDMSFTIKAYVQGKKVQDISIVVPSSVQNTVLMKDYQTSKSYMLGVEENGLIKQGDSFFYPEGFFIRASSPNIDSQNYQACLGIDRMYVLDTDLKTSTDPSVKLDRLVIPFSAKPGEEKTYLMGGSVPTTILIKAEIK
jgi:hypothetical protein